ncbi:MAG TPA: transglycosylase SLT domain-containing protein, partial [Spirochaetia bacterium]|nr:transglycosylase SLT domain-containing protein [Spirochaetia bacterium]
AILDNAVEYSVPVSLAFALAFEESQFHPRAINRNAESVDRGLFQLNSKSFPNMTIEQFYDPVLNAKKGIAHLAYCLDEGGNEVAALAIYNAGYGRVSKGGTPRKTLDYISRITKYASNLEALFEAQVLARRIAAAKDGTRGTKVE